MMIKSAQSWFWRSIIVALVFATSSAYGQSILRRRVDSGTPPPTLVPADDRNAAIFQQLGLRAPGGVLSLGIAGQTPNPQDSTGIELSNVVRLILLTGLPDALFNRELMPLVAPLLPDRLRPYLDISGYEQILGGGSPRPQQWRGNNEFEKAEARRRFLENEATYYAGLRLTVPIVIDYVQPVVLGQYDEQAQAFPLGSSWSWDNGGFRSLDGSSLIEAVAPVQVPRHLAVPPDVARHIREVETEQRAEFQRRAAAGTREPFVAPLVLTVRYTIRGFRQSGRSLLLDSAVQWVHLSPGLQRQTVLFNVPLPSGSEAAGQAGPSQRMPASTASETFALDNETSRLFMVRAEPKLLDNTPFLTQWFGIRRQIEAQQTNTPCRGPNCDPYLSQRYVPSTLTRSSASPTAVDLSQFATSMRSRAAALPSVLRVHDFCAEPQLCRKTDTGRVLQLPMAFQAAVYTPENLNAAKTIVPEAMLVSAMQVVGDIQILLAERLNVAWSGVPVSDAPVKAPIAVDFQVGKSGYVRRTDGKTVLVVEVDPLRYVVDPGAPGAREVSLLVPPDGQQALARNAAEPWSPWDILGVKLGMTSADAMAILQRQYQGARYTVLSEAPITGSSSLTPCQSLVLQIQSQAMTLFREENYRASNEHRPPLPASEQARFEAQLKIERRADMIRAGCPDPSVRRPGFGAGLQVDAGNGRRDTIALLTVPNEAGAPIVAGIYRELQGSSGTSVMRDGLIQRYGQPDASSDQNHAYWIENPVFSSLFSQASDRERCTSFWPYSGIGLPQIYQQIDCGALLRFDQERVILVDSHFLVALSRANAARAPQAPSPPPIKF